MPKRSAGGRAEARVFRDPLQPEEETLTATVPSPRAGTSPCPSARVGGGGRDPLRFFPAQTPIFGEVSERVRTQAWPGQTAGSRCAAREDRGDAHTGLCLPLRPPIYVFVYFSQILGVKTPLLRHGPGGRGPEGTHAAGEAAASLHLACRARRWRRCGAGQRCTRRPPPSPPQLLPPTAGSRAAATPPRPFPGAVRSLWQRPRSAHPCPAGAGWWCGLWGDRGGGAGRGRPAGGEEDGEGAAAAAAVAAPASAGTGVWEAPSLLAISAAEGENTASCRAKPTGAGKGIGAVFQSALGAGRGNGRPAERVSR